MKPTDIPELIPSMQALIHYAPVIAIVLAFVLAFFALAMIIYSKSNTIQWADLVSVLAHNGQQRGSWDPIGKGGGFFLCMTIPFIYAFSDKMDASGLALVMTPTLLYLGGVSAYSASLRAKQGTVETVKTVEIAPAATVTETRTETPTTTKEGGSL